MSKEMVVAGIVAYLFMASFLFAITFGSAAWNPGIDFDIETHDVNFSENFNLTALGIEVLEGEWSIQDGNLTSNAPINWFILTDELELSKGYPLTKEYEVYNMQKLTRFTVFYGVRAYLINWLDFRHSYWEFDIENNVLNCVSYKKSLLGSEEEVYYSGAYDFSGVENCIVKTYIDKPWGLARTHVLTEIYIDGSKIARAEWDEWMAAETLSATGGIYTEQPNLKVKQIVGLKRVGDEDPNTLGTMSILLRVMLFKPPAGEDGAPIMPLWLNFLGFKIPLLALGVVILCIARGV